MVVSLITGWYSAPQSWFKPLSRLNWKCERWDRTSADVHTSFAC
jgi:hypothetical protein